MRGTLLIARLTWLETRRRRIALAALICGLLFLTVFASAMYFGFRRGRSRGGRRRRRGDARRRDGADGRRPLRRQLPRDCGRDPAAHRFVVRRDQLGRHSDARVEARRSRGDRRRQVARVSGDDGRISRADGRRRRAQHALVRGLSSAGSAGADGADAARRRGDAVDHDRRRRAVFHDHERHRGVRLLRYRVHRRLDGADPEPVRQLDGAPRRHRREPAEPRGRDVAARRLRAAAGDGGHLSGRAVRRRVGAERRDDRLGRAFVVAVLAFAAWLFRRRPL